MVTDKIKRKERGEWKGCKGYKIERREGGNLRKKERKKERKKRAIEKKKERKKEID